MATKEKATAPQTVDPQEMVNELAAKAKVALEEYMKLDQEQVDEIAHAMALAGLDNHTKLAKLAVEETGRGVYEDKIIKNLFATEYIWHDIKSQKTVGIIEDDDLAGIMQIAEPVGIVAGVTPVTNPTSTTMFKAMIAAKARCPIIFGFHPSAQKCSAEAARIVRDAAIKAGAPENCVQWIEVPSLDATNALMNHPDIALVLATGGAGMVKAAYSTGKPALGVGPGNVPCYIEKSANLERACNDLMLSKTFDNGMICASEQAVIVDKELQKGFEKYMKDNSCYFLNEEETKKLSAYAFPAEKTGVNAAIVGKPAAWIAEQAGIKVPANTKILIARIPDVGPEYALSKEKLSPILAYIVVNIREEGFAMAKKMLHMGGLGHSAAIHSTDEEVIDAYGEAMQVLPPSDAVKTI